LIGLAEGKGQEPAFSVDRRLASMWFAWSFRPQGWAVPSPWDPIAGDYRSRDGWIRLHTNAPHHRIAALKVLGCDAKRDAVAKAVARHDAEDLETAVVAAGGCAAAMRSIDAWSDHPQGMAVATEPLVHVKHHDGAAPPLKRGHCDRALSGIRVLDLTRVLAGPIAGRFLAAYGARVLRIDPPDWDEPGVIPEVTLGKRCAGLDLCRSEDRAIFETLLRDVDVLLHGYRPGALDGLGFGADERRAINPALVDVSLNAYGWTGPWQPRRGFDSLVQMSSGIAHHGMAWSDSSKPTPLPVQALDHATGYLMAAAVIEGLKHRLRHGGTLTARLSLARTARLLTEHSGERNNDAMAPETAADIDPRLEETVWGPAHRIRFPATIEGHPAAWDLPAGPLRSSSAQWP
jgi:crotonobetainyl-CoA:carnitine CoA-transferase CaiB-like acyl-CoA transferase